MLGGWIAGDALHWCNTIYYFDFIWSLRCPQRRTQRSTLVAAGLERMSFTDRVQSFHFLFHAGAQPILCVHIHQRCLPSRQSHSWLSVSKTQRCVPAAHSDRAISGSFPIPSERIKWLWVESCLSCQLNLHFLNWFAHFFFFLKLINFTNESFLFFFKSLITPL